MFMLQPTLRGHVGKASRAALAAYVAEIENVDPMLANILTRWLHRIHEQLDRGELVDVTPIPYQPTSSAEDILKQMEILKKMVDDFCGLPDKKSGEPNGRG